MLKTIFLPRNGGWAPQEISCVKYRVYIGNNKIINNTKKNNHKMKVLH